MKPMAFMTAAACLAACLIGPGAASAGTPEAPRHKATIHATLSAKHAKSPRVGSAPRVSEQAARRIAWRSGVDHIEEINLSGERWEIAGRDRTGNEKALDIHAHDGSLLN